MNNSSSIVLYLTIIALILLSSIFQCNDTNCVNGYKILVRETIFNNTVKTYKLKYKCLCPNNYFGGQCQQHSSLYCYLQYIPSTNTPQSINNNNIKNVMPYSLNFTVECYVDYYERKMLTIELKEYLAKNNKSNSYGIQSQFGPTQQIIWANTTDIFDNNHELKIISKSEQNATITQDQIKKVIIGNNQQLFNNPFNYTDQFIGYGFYNGEVNFHIEKVDALKGVTMYKKLKTTDIQVYNLQEYIKSSIKKSAQQLQGKQSIQNITNSLKNGDIDIKQIIDSFTNNPQNNKILPLVLIQQKNLPIIQLQFQLQPYELASYQNIKLQLRIQQIYQGKYYHDVSMNSLLWWIPIENGNLKLGVPLSTDKQLILTDRSFKSYFKVLIVVGVVLVTYFVVKYMHKKYKKLKAKAYSQEEEQNVQNQGMFKQEYSLRSNQISISASTQNYQNKHLQLIEEK